MQHEPECQARYKKHWPHCICPWIKDAYHRGYEKGFGDGHEQGYRAGFNDHARSRAQAEAVYGPYRKPVPGNESVSLNSAPHFIQHGKGENP